MRQFSIATLQLVLILLSHYFCAVEPVNFSHHGVASPTTPTILAVGRNDKFQLGDSSQQFQSIPIPMTIKTGTPKFSQISAGSFHTLFLSSSSAAYGVGQNNGQLGDTTTINRHSPLPVDDSGALRNVKLVQISTGLSHTVFLSNEGLAYAVGKNNRGQLGDGATTTDQLSPLPVDTSRSLENVKLIQVSAGSDHTMFLSEDGFVYAVGANTHGQLGDGTTIDQRSPSKVILADEICQISAGFQFSMMISQDGIAYAVGRGNRGQLGTGTTTDEYSPVPVDTSGVLQNVTLIQVSAGYLHTVFLSNQGLAYTVGRNNFGQLGDGSTAPKLSPTPVDTSGVLQNVTLIQVSAGYFHTAFLSDQGVVYTVGRNHFGQLGDGTKTDRLSPVILHFTNTANQNVTAISAGYHHVALLSNESRAYAVGLNLYGQLGDGTQTNSPLAIPSKLPPFIEKQTQFLSASISPENSFLLSQSGEAYGVGSNIWMHGHPYRTLFPALFSLQLDFTVSQMSAGLSHTMFLSTQGVAYAVGKNGRGQLGTGSGTTYSPTPVDTMGVLNNVKLIQVSAGNLHTAFLSEDGRAYTTGYNWNGQLGDGTLNTRYSPVSVDTSGVLKNATLIQVSTGNDYTMFLSSEGVAYAVGANMHGQLGDGTTTDRSLPVVVQQLGGVTVIQIACGSGHTVFLSNDGFAYTTGLNTHGQLAHGTQNTRSTPLLVDALQNTTLIQVSAGSDHTVFLSNNGVVYAAGSNSHGQLGDGTTISKSLPIVMNGTGVVAFIDATHADHTILLANTSNSCLGGNYLHQSTGNCVPCPEGYYCPSFLPKPCPFGEWSTSGASSLDQCSVLLCEEGFLCSNGKQTPCSNGKWRQMYHKTCSPCPKYSACKNGTQLDCTQPPYYPLTSFEKGQSFCAVCASGNFLTTAASAEGQVYLCMPCSVGSACPGSGYAVECVGNLYAPGVSLHECEECPPGSYTNNNSITCTKCPSGHACVDGIFATPCPLGTFASSDSLQCEPCPPGFYCNGGGESTPCPPGYFSHLNGSSSLQNCTKCPAGWACNNGRRVNCTANTFTNVPASSSCLICPPGRHTDGSGTYCKDCEPGSFCQDGIHKSLCPDGTFSGYASKTSADCQSSLCPAGFSCAQGKKQQCSHNSYTDIPGLSTCKTCPVGAFTNGLGRSCEPCISLYFCPDGHHLIPCSEANATEHKLYNCPPCPEGQYRSDSQGCTVCESGFYCNGYNRTACPNGTYSKTGAPKMEHCKSTFCPRGHICLEGAMKPCRDNFYANSTGLTQCAVCPPGGYTNDQGERCSKCSTGSYCPDGIFQLSCKNAGYTEKQGMDHCQQCAPGTVSTRTDCSTCEKGFYCNGAAQIPCLYNEYSDETGLGACKLCPPGRYTVESDDSNHACVPCISGHFCNGSMTIPCPDSTWTPPNHLATKRSDCRREFCPHDKVCKGGKLEARDLSSEVSGRALRIGLSIGVPLFLLMVALLCCILLCCILAGVRVLHWRKSVRRESQYTQKLLQNFQQDQELLDLESEEMDRAKLIVKQNLMEVDVSEIEIDRKIGSGGSGAIVFSGTWKHETVALKIFRTTNMVGENFFQDFEKEVSLLTSLRHPRIITLYGVSLQPPRVALVMEYCPDSLSSLITSGRMAQYSASERLRLLVEVCEGMEYLHDKNVIHRDLKCDNVLISKQGNALITDFGLARQMSMQSQSAMTGQVGTSYYIAPELILHSHNRYNEKCDVFSFSIMAWEVLVGKLNPFEVQEAARLPLLIANNPDYRPSLDLVEFQEGAYAFVRLILKSCWDSDPCRRPSFNDIRQVLKQAMGGSM